ncbi:MAG: hypothetical protein OXI22_14650 [Defluviicoccus sp.]|nr:hypothetical protein [Defluviicoccus sp.]MDE0385122.1 hypothetical protein [Defluviicoccus sp.]
MPDITVSEDVLKKLRALRRPGEITDDQVLERIVGEASGERERRLRAYEAQEQDIQSTN